MNHFPTLIQALRADPWRIFPFAAITGAGLLTWKLKLPPVSHANATLYLLQAAALFMLFLSSGAATRLAQTARILAQRRVPAAVWRGSVTLRLASVWANGAALLAALAVTWVLGAATPAPLLVSIATLSLAACAGTLFSTVRSGLLPRQHNRTVHVVALAALVAFFSYGHAALTAFAQAPAAALVTVAASWPLMAFALRRHWRLMPQLIQPHVQPAAQTSGIPAWSAIVLRYAFLQPRFLQDNKLQFSMVSGMRMGTVSLCWSLMPPLALGGTLTVGHLLAFIPWIPAAMSMVAIRDLHWRTMLAPAGSGAPSLAMRIYWTSLKIAVFLLLVLMLGQALLDATLDGNAARILGKMENWLIFGMQAPLLVAVCVLLSALPNPRWTMWGAFIAAFLALAITHVGELYSVPVDGLQAGAVYAAGSAVLSGLVLFAAKRLWTQSRLLPYLPARPVSLAALSAAR